MTVPELSEPQKAALVRLLLPSRSGTHRLPRNTGAKLRTLGLVEGGMRGFFSLTSKGREIAVALEKTGPMPANAYRIIYDNPRPRIGSKL